MVLAGAAAIIRDGMSKVSAGEQRREQRRGTAVESSVDL
jgi:hypothetical protein